MQWLDKHLQAQLGGIAWKGLAGGPRLPPQQKGPCYLPVVRGQNRELHRQSRVAGPFRENIEPDMMGRTVCYLNVRPRAPAQSGAYTALCIRFCGLYQLRITQLVLTPEAIQD